MKKITAILLLLSACILLAACGASTAPAAPTPTVEPTPAPAAAPAPAEEPVAPQEEELPREPSLIFARDLFDGYGYVHQQCDVTGEWGFYPISSEGVTWEVYILDKEFDDAERFIPQAYPRALEGSGTLSLEAGQWIYIYCPCNSWTMQEAPEGCAFSWGLA